MEPKLKIKSFRDLNSWSESYKLAVLIYKITNTFPPSELYSLTSQMRRCAISISSNIAEGFSRQGFKEKLQFYYTAKGSLTELQNQLLIAQGINYLDEENFNNLYEQSVLAGKLLTGLIKSLKNQA